jgi:Cytochrome P460
MRRIHFLLIAVAMLVGGVVCVVPASGRADKTSAPVYLTEMPKGFRDWQLISVAHEAGNLNSLGAMLGNDVAMKAYREKKLPYPDGTVIAALHYSHLPNTENNAVFGKVQSFTPGPPSNYQFMVKDSKKYAATDGWGFGSFTPDGKPFADAQMKSCAPCHAKASRDGVFTTYAP